MKSGKAPRRTAGLIAVSGALILFGSGAAAQCFCLAHPTTGEIVHYGCEARTIPNRVSERVSCLLADRRDRGPVQDAASFSRIPGEEGSCNPCAPSPSEDGAIDFPRTPNQVDPAQPDATGATPHE